MSRDKKIIMMARSSEQMLRTSINSARQQAIARSKNKPIMAQKNQHVVDLHVKNNAYRHVVSGLPQAIGRGLWQVSLMPPASTGTNYGGGSTTCANQDCSRCRTLQETPRQPGKLKRTRASGYIQVNQTSHGGGKLHKFPTRPCDLHGMRVHEPWQVSENDDCNRKRDEMQPQDALDLSIKFSKDHPQKAVPIPHENRSWIRT
jgi:hypothetical protein